MKSKGSDSIETRQAAYRELFRAHIDEKSLEEMQAGHPERLGIGERSFQR